MPENQTPPTKPNDAEGVESSGLLANWFRRFIFRLGFVPVTRKQLREWRNAAEDAEMATIKIEPLNPVDHAALTARHLAIREIIDDVCSRAFNS